MKLYKILNNPLFLISLLLFNCVASLVYGFKFNNSMFIVLGSITGSASLLGFYSYFVDNNKTYQSKDKENPNEPKH